MVQSLAHRLECWPLNPGWPKRRQADASESIVVAEVRNAGQRDLPTPQIPWQILLRRERRLGELSVPLSPNSLLGIGEVQRFDHGSSLPPVVCRIRRRVMDVAASRDVAPPSAREVRRIDVQRLDGAWGFQAGEHLGNAPVLAAGDDIERLVVIE